MIEAIITNYSVDILEEKTIKQYSLFDLDNLTISSNKLEKLIDCPAVNL